jgi:nitrogen fixation-related uncharacterized protein
MTTEPLWVLGGMLMVPLAICIVATMRASMFWCSKCRTYHYKDSAPARCFRDYAESVARREARLRRMTNALHRK